MVKCEAARRHFLALQKLRHAPFPPLCKYVGFIWEPRPNPSSQLRQECYQMLSKLFSHSHRSALRAGETVKRKKCCNMSLYEMLITVLTDR